MKTLLMITNAMLLAASVAGAQSSAKKSLSIQSRPTTSEKNLEIRSKASSQDSKNLEARSDLSIKMERENIGSTKVNNSEKNTTRSRSLSMEGQDKGNGGFLYSRTSKKLLDEAQASLLAEMKSLIASRPQLTYTSEKCAEPIDMKQLESIFANMTYTFDKGTSTVNYQGREEERYFQVNSDGKVEATALYFNSFIDTYFRYIEEKELDKKDTILGPVRMAIVHESLHLFQYNQAKAEICSQELAQVIASYSDWKLKRLQMSVQKENDQLVKENLIHHNCLSEEDFQKFKTVASHSGFADEYYSQWSRHLLKCVAQEMSPIQKEFPMNFASDYISSALYQSETFDDLAHRLNQIIHFPFEMEIPTKK